MKKLVGIAIAFLVFSCKKESTEPFGTPTKDSATDVKTETAATPEALGKKLFETKGACIACHSVNTKLIGPSLQDIAKIYKQKNGDMVTFFKGEGEAIVDPSQFNLMKPNLELTKTFSDEELKALEIYVNSHLK